LKKVTRAFYFNSPDLVRELVLGIYLTYGTVLALYRSRSFVDDAVVGLYAGAWMAAIFLGKYHSYDTVTFYFFSFL